MVVANDLRITESKEFVRLQTNFKKLALILKNISIIVSEGCNGGMQEDENSNLIIEPSKPPKITIPDSTFQQLHQFVVVEKDLLLN